MKSLALGLCVLISSSVGFAMSPTPESSIIVGVNANSAVQNYRNVLILGDAAAELFEAMKDVPNVHGVKQSNNIKCSTVDKPRCELSVDALGQASSQLK